MKKIRIIWAVSLLAVGFAAVMLVLDLPDAAVRTLGAAELIALPALAYATVRLAGRMGERR